MQHVPAQTTAGALASAQLADPHLMQPSWLTGTCDRRLPGAAAFAHQGQLTSVWNRSDR